jgi:hypothetical protein
MAMEGDKDKDDLPPITEDIGLPTPPSPGRVPPPHLPPADPGESDADDGGPAPEPPGSGT